MKSVIFLALLAISASISFGNPTTQPAARPSTQPSSIHYDAWQLIRDARYAEARDAFKQLTKDDPKDAAAFGGLGAAHLFLGIDQEAAYALERAKLLNPGDRIALHNLVVARMRLENYDKASGILTAMSKGGELTEHQVDMWITAATKLDNWTDPLKAAIARIETTRPGFRKWGVNWVSEEEARNLQESNAPLVARAKAMRKRVEELGRKVKQLAGKVEAARRELAMGGDDEDERRQLRTRLEKLEKEFNHAKYIYDIEADQLNNIEARIMPTPILHGFNPVVVGT